MKTLSQELQKVTKLFDQQKIRFALSGGLVASLYRKEARMTNDLDFLFLAEDKSDERATTILKKLGLKPHFLRIAELMGGPLHAIKNRSTPIGMVCGLVPEGRTGIQVDFLFPQFPWFQTVLARAQNNQVDFGFGRIPCLTAEDVIIMKLFAMENQSTRFKDLDDLSQIFQSTVQLDLNYLSEKVTEWNLKIPVEIRKIVPSILRRVQRK